jgi:uncharacterized membrane protein YfcA
LTLLTFSLLLIIVAYIAGFLGALTGLGGGVILIPVLVLLFQVDIHFAMGASLISVIATSSGATIAYLKEGYTNLRIGMFLETGAVVGALLGALLLTILPVTFITLIFSFVLIISSYLTWQRQEESEGKRSSHAWANHLRLEGSYPTEQGTKSYSVQNVPWALGIMTLAGGLSGLLGIGSGALKVLAMDQALRLPYKVATTTSNFMIGITAAVSAGIYFSKGYVNPVLTFPVLLGVVFGAFSGARILPMVHQRKLRLVFCIVLLFLAIEMLYKGITGSL